MATFTRVVAQAAAGFRRSRRLFHPWGECFAGTITLLVPGTLGIREEYPCLVRLSKGLGFVGAVPDALGLAIRIERPQPWDVLMVSSAGTGVLGRLIITPSALWTRPCYSTLMPYQRADGELMWLHARALGGHTVSVRRNALTEAIKGAPLGFELLSGASNGAVHWVGELTLERTAEPGLSFDPGVNQVEYLRLYPGWLTAIRSSAYLGSRQSRGATLSD
ncbi:hypothetical protein IEU95_08785 [Hoyosella rhizosphaerae]|nr:hypothetical protein [Hoyosella rhizosphaerae]MBN4926925.1 hypothetical protein [Hoyosella rhizosphaerae]